MNNTNVAEFFEFQTQTVKMQLPLCKLPELGIAFYALILMGKSELNVKLAEELWSRVQEAGFEFDTIVTAEAKALGLVEEFARVAGKKEYVVLRKSVKAYENDFISTEVKSLTTATVQNFYLYAGDFEQIKGRKCLFIDDVISTGGTISKAIELIERAGGKCNYAACIATEGEQFEKKTDEYDWQGKKIKADNLISLGQNLPLIILDK